MRVFHRFGDYEHRQRNRMKFVIKRAGLGRLSRAKFEEASPKFASGGRRAPAVRSADGSRRRRRRPTGACRRRRRLTQADAAAASTPVTVPASCPAR